MASFLRKHTAKRVSKKVSPPKLHSKASKQSIHRDLSSTPLLQDQALEANTKGDGPRRGFPGRALLDRYKSRSRPSLQTTMSAIDGTEPATLAYPCAIHRPPQLSTVSPQGNETNFEMLQANPSAQRAPAATGMQRSKSNEGLATTHPATEPAPSQPQARPPPRRLQRSDSMQQEAFAAATRDFARTSLHDLHNNAPDTIEERPLNTLRSCSSTGDISTTIPTASTPPPPPPPPPQPAGPSESSLPQPSPSRPLPTPPVSRFRRFAPRPLRLIKSSTNLRASARLSAEAAAPPPPPPLFTPGGQDTNFGATVLTRVPVCPPQYNPRKPAAEQWQSKLLARGSPVAAWAPSKRWRCCCCGAETMVEQRVCSRLLCGHPRCDEMNFDGCELVRYVDDGKGNFVKVEDWDVDDE